MFKHNSRLTWWAAAMLPVLFLACGTVSEAMGPKATSWPLRASADIPSAQGTVKVSNDGPNKKVKIEVEHLAPPERVLPSATAYVVWLVPQGEHQPRNVGALKVNDDLKGELEVETPFPEFDIYVTAEPTPRVTTPTNKQLLTASVHPIGTAIR